ncbi:hypothetical protein TNCV_866341 [Trichonephila clavipes]|nr:hypothetical protein TNCV_866341 [Trichonephila clavipes]
MKTTNQHGTWGCKPCLNCENRNNSNRREDDKPDEGVAKRMRGFGAHACKFRTSPGVLAGSTRRCSSFMIAHQHIFRLRCVTISMLQSRVGDWRRQTYCLASTLSEP